MLPIPEACRPSMERARDWRRYRDRTIPGYTSSGAVRIREALAGSEHRSCRRETREILRSLRALRRAEEAELSIGRAVAVREGGAR